MAVDLSNYSFNEALEWVAGAIRGTCDSLEKYVDYLQDYDFEVDADDLESYLLDYNVEQCAYCGWWHECHELVDADGDYVGCDQCRGDNER